MGRKGNGSGDAESSGFGVGCEGGSHVLDGRGLDS